VNSGFTKSTSNPLALYLTCPSVPQMNSYQSPDKDKSRTLATLQSSGTTGRYGQSADTPYLRTRSLSTLVHSDCLKQTSVLHFRMMREGDDANTGFRPCLQPNSATVWGYDYSFGLVFWELEHKLPRTPTVTFDFYKVFLRSVDRSQGTAADCRIPVSMTTHGSMAAGRWFVGIDSISTVTHPVMVPADMSAGILVTSQTFNPGADNNRILGYLGRTFRTAEDTFGLRLTTKPLARDHVGFELKSDALDDIADIHIAFRKQDGSALTSANLLRDWALTLVFYRSYS
jgi:hypothetical protein